MVKHLSLIPTYVAKKISDINRRGKWRPRKNMPARTRVRRGTKKSKMALKRKDEETDTSLSETDDDEIIEGDKSVNVEDVEEPISDGDSGTSEESCNTSVDVEREDNEDEVDFDEQIFGSANTSKSRKRHRNTDDDTADASPEVTKKTKKANPETVTTATDDQETHGREHIDDDIETTLQQMMH